MAKANAFAVNTAPAPNVRGEVAGLGAEWSCPKFGMPDHNYIVCPVCLDNFDRWWERDGKRRGKK
jgi:hypothetical protein